MFRRRVTLVLLLLAVLIATTANASVVYISQDDNGREFDLDRGDALEISLPATSGTGYTWQAMPVAGRFVKQAGEPEFRRDNAMPGARGRQVFHFSVGSSGSGVLEMRYVRPWEKKARPAKIFKISLTAH